MSEIIKDGGPAFPLNNWDTIHWPSGTPADFGVGMTLRDWFAGRALQSIIAIDGVQFAYNLDAHAAFAYEQIVKFDEVPLEARMTTFRLPSTMFTCIVDGEKQSYVVINGK